MMEKNKLKSLYNAIKSDNVKVFTSFMVHENNLSLSFGRFPILSLCYMFKSFKILDKYEKKLLPISKFEVVFEYAEIYIKFKKLAKKSIRYFVANNQSIVYPIFVLALLGDNDSIRNNYDLIYKNAEINAILSKIYANLGQNNTKIAINSFEAKQNKHSLFQKLFIVISCFIMCLMLAFPTISILVAKQISGLGTNLSPISISTTTEFVSAIKSGKRNYKLVNDIKLESPVSVKNFSGKIDGNGHTVLVNQNQTSAIFESLSGELKNIKFEINIDNLLIKKDFAVISNKLSGKIDNCEVSGKISAKFNCSEDTYFSVFATENSGEILNSISSVSISAENDSKNNAFLSVFAGKNNGTISYSETTKGELKTDTVDVAGIVAENNGKIISCTNRLNIYQSSEKEWHPNSAGIVLNNNGEILDSKNYGDVSSISLNEESSSDDNKNGFAVYVAGIACNSINKIERSKNYGNLVAKAETATIYAGGIVAMNAISDKSMGTINLCKAVCTIVAENKDNEREMFVGGLCGISNTNILSSGYEGDLKINSAGRAEVGGLVGAHYQGVFNNYLTAIANCYSAATLSKDSSGAEIYFGLVVGTCTTGDGINLSYLLVNDFYVSNGASQFYHVIQYSESEKSHPQEKTLNSLKGFNSLEELKNNLQGEILDD